MNYNKLYDFFSKLLSFLFKTPLYSSIQTKKFFVITIEKGEAIACALKGTLKSPSIVKKNIIQSDDGGYLSPESILALADLAAQGYSVKKSKIVLTVPKEWCIIKTAVFPEAAFENFSNVLSYDMDNLTPFTSEDVIYDYNITGKDNNMVEAAIYVLNNQRLNQYLDILTDNGYIVKAIIPTNSCLVRLCNYALKTDSVNLINVKNGLFELSVSKNGILIGTYYFKTGKELFGFLNKTQTTDEDEDQLKVVINSSDQLNYKVEELKGFLPADSTQDIDSLPLPVKARPSYLYSTALGVLVNEYDKDPLNLLTLGTRQKKKTPFVLSSLLAILIIALLGGIYYIPIWKAEQYIEEVDRQLKKLKPEIKKIDELKNKAKKTQEDITAYNGFIGKEVQPPEVLRELTKLTPMDTWFIRLEIGEEKIKVDGYSSSASSLLALIEKSPLFKNAQFTSTTVKDPRVKKDRFKIQATIENIRPNE